MLKNSVTIKFFISFFRCILNIYNNSFTERLFSGICSFFSSHWNKSALKKILLPETNGNIWKNSACLRFLTLPIRLIKKLPGAGVVNRAEKKSLPFYILKNAFDLPIRLYGILIFSLVVGSCITTFLFEKNTTLNTLAIVAFAVISLFCLLLPCSIKSLCRTSGIFNFAAKTVFFEDFDKLKEKHKKIPHGLPVLCTIIICIGAICGYFGAALSFVAIIGVVAVFAVLFNVYIGVFTLAVLFPILPTMVNAGLAVLTFISFCIKLWKDKTTVYIFTPFNMIIVAFLAVSIISSIAGYAPASSLQIVMLYIAFALVYMLIVNTVTTRRTWNMLVKSMVICGILLAVYGLLQNFILTSTTQSWVDKNMFENIKTRVYATLDNPNVLGQYFIFTIPLTFAVLWKTKDEKSFLFYAFACLLMVACLLYTWSRSAWVGVVLALGLFLVVKDRRWLIVCLIGLFLLPFVLPESILTRLTSLGNTNDSSTAYRISIWTSSIEMAKDYFVGGIGIGTDAYASVYPKYALSGARTAFHAHNFYLQWIVETGIFGLTIFFAFILRAYRQIAKIGEKNTLIKNFSIALAGILIGYLFQAVAEHMWYNFKMVLMFFVYLGILQSGVNIYNKENLGEVAPCIK